MSSLHLSNQNWIKGDEGLLLVVVTQVCARRSLVLKGATSSN